MRTILLTSILWVGTAFAQTAKLPAFEVASVRPAVIPDVLFAAISWSDPCGKPKPQIQANQVAFSRVSICSLVRFAYDVQEYQVTGGPKWWRAAEPSVYFDIQAKVQGEGSPSEQQTRALLQTLLAERFQLKLHHETKPIPVYALEAGKNPKLPGPTPNICKLPEEQRVAGNGRLYYVCDPPGTIAQLAQELSWHNDRPVVDRTGLAGKYAFSLRWTQSDKPLELGSPPYLFTAVQEQLGLQIEEKNLPFDVLVVDTIERPSEN